MNKEEKEFIQEVNHDINKILDKIEGKFKDPSKEYSKIMDGAFDQLLFISQDLDS